MIIDIIKQGEKKEGLITKLVSVQQQPKDLSTQGCGGACQQFGSVTCTQTPGSCSQCSKKSPFDKKAYCKY